MKYRPSGAALISRIVMTIAIWALLAGSCHAASGGPYLSSLQQRAQALALAISPMWHALLHYERDWLGAGVTSAVASDWFFLADNGRHDPAAELAASLAAFFAAAPISPQARPARCALPARFNYLVRALSIDTTRLPPVNCPEYQQWLAQLNPASVTLVFPAAFPNSPASMFGHTLLRINSQRLGRATKLLSYAVNFAASTAEDKGVLYAVKGLTGGYPGVFGIFPYYRKVKQYAWINSRDIWSYPLHLKPAELRRLVAHLWTMRQVRFRYYFLSKNCSYQLLALIDVARPRLRLTQRFDWYTVPTDTIRALASVPGFLGAANYRPSLQTTLHWHGQQLDAAQRQLALGLARGQLALDSARLRRLPARSRARVLEVAHDWLYYQRQAAADHKARSRLHAILLARSRIDTAADFAPVPEPQTPPNKGHGTFRMGLDGGWADDVFSIGLHIRPAYHDLLDDPAGYISGAGINFLDLALRLRPSTGDVRLDHLTLMNIISIAPRGPLFKPISWQLDTGVRRRPAPFVFTDAANNLGYYVQGGPGLAWGDQDLLGYVFGQASLDVNSAANPAYMVGTGLSAGVLAHPSATWQLRAEAGYMHYVAGADGHYGWLRLGQQWGLTDQLALRMSVAWTETAVADGASFRLGLRAYY